MQRYFIKSFLLYLFFHLSTISFGQSIGNDVNEFNKEKNKYIKSFLASNLAIHYLQRNQDSVVYFKKFVTKNIEKGGLSEAGCIHLEIQEKIGFGNAKNCLNRALKVREIFKKYNKIDELESINTALGFIYIKNSDFTKSSACYLQVYAEIKNRLKTEKNNRVLNSNYSTILSHLSYLYYNVGEYAQAIKYNTETGISLLKSRDLKGYAYTISNSGSIYMKLKEYGNAITCFTESSKIREAEVTPEIMGYNEYQVSICYVKLQKYDSALLWYDKSISLRSSNKNNFVPMIMMEHLRGQILVNNGNPKEGIFLCLKVYNSLLAKREILAKKDACNCLMEGYFELGDYKNAYKFLEEYTLVCDTIIREEVKSSFEIKSKFIQLEKSRYLDSLKNEESLKFDELEIKEQRDSLYKSNMSLGLLSFLLIGLLITIYYLFKTNSKNREIAKTLTSSLQEKEILLKEIHHRVKNNFQVISSLLNIQANSVVNIESAAPLREAQNRILSMALVHQKLYGKEGSFTHINMKSYFIELIDHYSTLFFDDKSKLEFNIEVNDIELDLERAVPLGLFSNEVITNSLKYGRSENGIVYLSINMLEVEDCYVLTITDKGKGFDRATEVNDVESLGQELIQILAEQLNGKLIIENRNGAFVSLEFAKK
jgi:two-component sensor histidine kinase